MTDTKTVAQQILGHAKSLRVRRGTEKNPFLLPMTPGAHHDTYLFGRVLL
jgi:hypothetical protein